MDKRFIGICLKGEVLNTCSCVSLFCPFCVRPFEQVNRDQIKPSVDTWMAAINSPCLSNYVIIIQMFNEALHVVHENAN